MQLANGKVCIECKTELGRYWGNNLCEKHFRELLKENLKEEDKRHADRVNQTS